MSSNGNTITDEDGDSSDWTELFNTGETAIDLSFFALSDNVEKPFKWIFSEVSVRAGEFLLVWASGKDRAIPRAPLHTGFNIKAAGEEILLTGPDGELVGEILPVKIPVGYSYGRKTDGSEHFFFFS